MIDSFFMIDIEVFSYLFRIFFDMLFGQFAQTPY